LRRGRFRLDTGSHDYFGYLLVSLDVRASLPDTAFMKPADLIRRLRRLATKRGWDLDETEGANHTKITLNGKRAMVGRHRADLKTGTLHGILKQLGLKPDDLEN
jgi:mRNA interferase HicA